MPGSFCGKASLHGEIGLRQEDGVFIVFLFSHVARALGEAGQRIKPYALLSSGRGYGGLERSELAGVGEGLWAIDGAQPFSPAAAKQQAAKLSQPSPTGEGELTALTLAPDPRYHQSRYSR